MDNGTLKASDAREGVTYWTCLPTIECANDYDDPPNIPREVRLSSRRPHIVIRFSSFNHETFELDDDTNATSDAVVKDDVVQGVYTTYDAAADAYGQAAVEYGKSLIREGNQYIADGQRYLTRNSEGIKWMTPERIAELKALCANATGVPWGIVEHDYKDEYYGYFHEVGPIGMMGKPSNSSRLIAAIPELIVEVERLTQENDALGKQLYGSRQGQNRPRCFG